MNTCKRILALLLSVFIIFATLPVSSVVLAEEVSTPKIFQDNFDDASSLENYEVALNNAYYGTTLNAKDVAPTIETVDGKSVFRSYKAANNNQQVASLLKNMPTDRRVESVTTTFKQATESANEDAMSSIVAFNINARNSLTLTVYPYYNKNDSNTDNLEYIYYSWCRFTYRTTGSASTQNNCCEAYKDEVSGTALRRVKTGMKGDNNDWFTVTLNYDYSKISENILTISATLKDTEGNEYSLSSFAVKFNDTVYDCTDADGNVLESGQYLKYDENFKVGISSNSGSNYGYYDNFKVQYSKTPQEFADDFKAKYSEELAITQITNREQFDDVAKAKHAIEENSDEIKALLSAEKAKLSAALETYTVVGDDFEYESLSAEVWETVPYSGDILTWNSNSSTHVPATPSERTQEAKFVADSKDSENTVFSPEIRSQKYKVKMSTINDKYLKKGAAINSFSVDFRMDKNNVWDTNSGIYYYYKDPYNWGRIEFSTTNDGLINTRFMQNKGNADGTNMVSTTLLGNCPLAGTCVEMWINIKVDYEYLEDGTNLTFTYTDKSTGTVLYSKTYKTIDFNNGGKVGIASSSTASSIIYYDNFNLSFTKNADDFRNENAEVLSWTSITSKEQFNEVANVKAALDELPSQLKEQLSVETEHLLALLGSYKVLSDDFELEGFTNEAFESLPETGDIMTWIPTNSAFATGTSVLTKGAQIIEEADNTSNHVLKSEIRNQSRKRKILTLKDAYRRTDAAIKSFSTDVRMDVSAGWDANSGLYYWYKNPYNWGRIEFILSSSGDLNLTCRILEQTATAEGANAEMITRASNTAFTGVASGDWATVKVDYVYTEEGTNIVVSLYNAATGEFITSKNFTSENVVGDFKVGYGSSSNASEITYYDNFELEYTKSANEFKAENERVLALDSSSVQISDLADVNAALSEYETLHYSVKAELASEGALLKALKAKIVRLQKQDTIYISQGGNDNNNGTSGSPVATFDAAVALLNEGGSIYIVGEYVASSKFTFNSYGRDLVITGGTLDLSDISNVNFADNITFDNVTLKFKDNGNVYANGHNLTINNNVTVVGTANLYGGGAAGTTVDSTNLKILSGNYKNIYGGSRQGVVSGDTNLYIGGNVNKDIVTALAHANTANIYGGGVDDTVGGNTNIIFTDNALSSYVSGGGIYATSGGTVGTVGGDTNIVVSGNAKTYGVYGGSKAAGTVGGDINVLIDGGAVADLFGGHGSANHEGNVYIELKKGSVDRRLWGGCYNENSGLSWATSNHVIGSIYVTVWNGFTFVFDGKDSLNSSYNDLSFYAHSRCKNQSDEISNIIYVDSAAYNSIKGKEKWHDSDFSSSIFMSSAAPKEAADNIYYCSYSANENTITKTYNKVSGAAISNGTATIAIDENVSLEYTGNAIEAAKVTYNNWFAHNLDITYSNNVEVGTATATISTNGVSASTTFDIYYDTTPTLLGASIKKSLTQDIQFTARLPKSSKKVAEYGMAVTFYNNIGNGVELSEMTANTTNEAVTVAKRILSVPVIMSQETFTLNIGKIDADKYGYRYVVRAFVRYEGDSTYYYSDDNTGSLSSMSGVENGYASRSVIGISKSILSWVYENQDVLHNEYGVADVNAIIKKNETTGKYSWVSGITANNGEKVLAYLNDNAEAISEAIKDLS